MTTNTRLATSLLDAIATNSWRAISLEPMGGGDDFCDVRLSPSLGVNGWREHYLEPACIMADQGGALFLEGARLVRYLTAPNVLTLSDALVMVRDMNKGRYNYAIIPVFQACTDQEMHDGNLLEPSPSCYCEFVDNAPEYALISY